MATIYLSSTYKDLQDYRRAVVEALRQSGHQVIGMEDYVASDRRPVDECLLDVERADMYVGLFAFRYGYVPPADHKNPNGLSITELEFRHADNLKKPCLLFVAKRDAGIPLDLVDAYTGDGDKGVRIERLRQDVLKEKLASEFSQPHKLATLVLAAVTKHLEGRQQPATPIVKGPAAPAAITWDIKEKDSPYPGLMNFTRDYAPVFFGRDLEVGEILDRMRLGDGRFIIISGDSGVGKSSVVAAGVLPYIEKQGLPGGERCDILHMLPGKTQQPWRSLMMAGLGAMVTGAGLRPDDILEDLTHNPEALAGHLNTITKKGSKSRTLLLFLDQMEELFTSQDMTQSNRFLTALYHAAQEKALWVVATIRSDHLHYCHRHPEMVKVLRGQGHYPLGRVEPYMMQDMIVKPAQCAGLSLSEGLARRLIEDMERDSANLPLLAFVLNQLFEKRRDHELSEAVYRTIGGVSGAIGTHVADVEGKIQKQLGGEAEEVLASIFQTLANVQKEEGLPTRNRPLLTSFSPTQQTAIDLLVMKRLLRTEGEGEAATVSLTHEKLFEAWPALKDYVDKHKKVLVDRTLLESRARKWENLGKPWFDSLASGREYKDFRRAGMAATPLSKEYLHASRRAWWIQAGVIGAFLLVVGGLGAWLWREGLNLEDAFLTAQSKFRSIHLTPVMQPIRPEAFQQGDTHGSGEESEKPVHKVMIKPFAIGKFEVTFEEYKRFAIDRGRPVPHDQDWGRGRRPVINVSWQDARDYAAWLSNKTGKRYRLPTESEWEYAARSGEKDNIWAGPSDEGQLHDYAVFRADRTEPVGSKKRNDLGLYDMSGNVWEWVEDCWHDNYNGAPEDGSTWLEAGEGDCGQRVFRGGSWNDTPEFLRSSIRYGNFAVDRSDFVGFRLAQDMDN